MSEDTFDPKSATWWDIVRDYETPVHLEHFSGFPSKSEMLRRGVLTVDHPKPHKPDAVVHDTWHSDSTPERTPLPERADELEAESAAYLKFRSADPLENLSKSNPRDR